MALEKNNDAINLKAIEKVKAKFPDLDPFYLDLGIDMEIHHVMYAFTNYILDHQKNLKLLEDSVDLINEMVEENYDGEINSVIDALEMETFQVLCPHEQLTNYYLSVLSPQAKLLYRDCYYNKHHLGYDI